MVNDSGALSQATTDLKVEVNSLHITRAVMIFHSDPLLMLMKHRIFAGCPFDVHGKGLSSDEM